MDRNKVLELAREGGLVHQWQTQGEQHDILKTLERFAALIEAEVRVDAEPTLYQRRMRHLFDYRFQWSAWEECSKEVFNQHERQQIWGDYVYEARKLYLHPAPAVVRQLVEALEQLMSIVKIYSRATSNNFAWAEMDFAKEALAAAKEAGL